jgi:H+-transporting ATPase
VWVGYYTDRNAGNAVKELQELAAPTALCRRDGEWRDLAVKELVPGDVVALKGGDVIPADCIVSHSIHRSVGQIYFSLSTRCCCLSF